MIPLAPAALAALCALASPQGAPLFSTDEYRDDLEQLASDEFEGRGIHSPGEEKTVAFLASRLRAAGFAPGAGSSFEQAVPFVSLLNSAPAKLSFGDVALRALDDFVVVSRRQQPKVVASGELLFVGYGCDAPGEKWDDFKGVDCAGKVLLFLINDPPASDGRFGGKAMTYFGRWTYKYEEAARRKAAGAIIVHETEPAAYPWEVVRNSWGAEQFDAARDDGGASRCPFEAWITREAAAGLFRKAGKELDAAKAAAARDDFRPFALGAVASCEIDQVVTPITSRNVVGVLPGTDERRTGEHLLLCAHWDHFGKDPKKEGDQIFNGAVDNASGCAGVLALARAIARGPRPARSTIVLFVTGEERGLLGSQHYADHPVTPLEKALAVINLDGVNVWGRTRDLSVVGMGQSTLEALLDAAIRKQGRSITPDPEPEKGLYFRSDQLSFARKGVPALYVKSGVDFVGRPAGFGEEMRKRYTAELYHKPGDEFDPTWEFGGAIEDLSALLEVARHVLEDAEWPRWSAGSEFRALRPEPPGASPAR